MKTIITENITGIRIPGERGNSEMEIYREPDGRGSKTRIIIGRVMIQIPTRSLISSWKRSIKKHQAFNFLEVRDPETGLLTVCIYGHAAVSTVITKENAEIALDLLRPVRPRAH